LIRPLGSARKRCLSDVTSLIAAGKPDCIRDVLTGGICTGGICELAATVALGEMAGVVGGVADVMSGTEGAGEMEVAPVHAALKRATPTRILASIRFTGDVPSQFWRDFSGEDRAAKKKVPWRR